MAKNENTTNIAPAKPAANMICITNPTKTPFHLNVEKVSINILPNQMVRISRSDLATLQKNPTIKRWVDGNPLLCSDRHIDRGDESATDVKAPETLTAPVTSGTVTAEVKSKEQIN